MSSGFVFPLKHMRLQGIPLTPLNTEYSEKQTPFAFAKGVCFWRRSRDLNPGCANRTLLP